MEEKFKITFEDDIDDLPTSVDMSVIFSLKLQSSRYLTEVLFLLDRIAKENPKQQKIIQQGKKSKKKKEFHFQNIFQLS
eukprot:gene2093-1964_t